MSLLILSKLFKNHGCCVIFTDDSNVFIALLLLMRKAVC